MSSRRPNMQNLPKRAGKEVRRPIVARPGHKLVCVDYEGIESRLLAYYLNDESYIELFEGGHDPHAWMAACIHGGEIGDYTKDSDNRDKRDVAKNTTFAITYGAGAPRVSDMNKITKQEAKALISQITGSLPKYHKLKGRIRKKVQTQGHVKTLFGRTQPIKRDKAYVGLNALIQGTAADIMKQGLINANEAIQEYGAHLLLVVHDEGLFEAPAEYAERVEAVVSDAFCAAVDIRPALAVESTIVDSYEDA